MDHLIKFGKVKPISFHGKLISIKLTLTIKGHIGKTIIFKDSMLMLPKSLRQLCESFNIDNKKGVFPFLLNDINYKGLLPNFNLFPSISNKEYISLKDQYSNNIWSFKDEAIKYCKKDCLVLHNILVKFKELIFNEFKVDPISALTLASLAMKIYKTLYLPNYHTLKQYSVYQLNGLPEQNIRESYTGGAVDVYIPQNKNNEKLYVYDVNALYPSVMLNNPMPIAQPIAFQGNIRLVEPDAFGIFYCKITGFIANIQAKFIKLWSYDVNALYPAIMAKTPMPIGLPIAFDGDIRAMEPEAFGFFYCKITSPEYLEHPILQRRIKTVDGLRTIAGLGTWEGWIYSTEMDNAMRYGYTFEILKGYQFEKGYIFKEYIETMYNLRLEYDKSHPMNLIAKLLMNSLYGKFGMRMESTIIDIFNTTNKKDIQLLDKLLETQGSTIQDLIKIDNHYLSIRKSLLNYRYSDDEDMYHGLDVNIAIASAISGGARVWMSTFKNRPEFNLYYSDTDNLVIDAPLPEILVGSLLGQFKLEHQINRAVFLAPKVYGFINTDGTEVIKIKGLSKEALLDIHVNDLESLLIKDSSLEFSQTKWFKKLIEGEITVKEVAYTLKSTSNKRSPIFIDNILSNTNPYYYDEINNK